VGVRVDVGVLVDVRVLVGVLVGVRGLIGVGVSVPLGGTVGVEVDVAVPVGVGEGGGNVGVTVGVSVGARTVMDLLSEHGLGLKEELMLTVAVNVSVPAFKASRFKTGLSPKD